MEAEVIAAYFNLNAKPEKARLTIRIPPRVSMTDNTPSDSRCTSGLCNGPVCTTKNPKKYHSKCIHKRCATCCSQECNAATITNQHRAECAVHFDRSKSLYTIESIPLSQSMLPVQTPSNTAFVDSVQAPLLPKKLYSTSLSPIWSAEARQAQLQAEQIKNARHVRFSQRAKTKVQHTIKLVIWHTVISLLFSYSIGTK